MIAIDPLFPAPPSFIPLPACSVPPPRIQLLPLTPQASGSKLSSLNSIGLRNWADDTVGATVTRLERATGKDWFQDVEHLELQIDDGTTLVFFLFLTLSTSSG